MPASDSPVGVDTLVDTSVAVPLIVEDHESHEVVLESLSGQTLGLSGHAAFETFSVLTRLPTPLRRSPREVGDLLQTNFPESRFLGAEESQELIRSLPRLGISGGAVYDALVAAVAQVYELPLTTRDSRALDTYRLFDVELNVVG